ncbi:MAG TPA: regulatory protein RecX [Ignavibacteriaceae bacterium]|nr:regulatory protein RecX [Ignavibacteriaceae bacterium]
MKIIRVVKKDENNVVVYLDNDEKLYLTYEVFLKNGLRKDKEVPEGHFDFLVKENQKYHIKNKAYSYIARRHHSVFEIRAKLWQKKYDKDLIEIVLLELIDNKYLDDREFAGIFTDEKIRLKLWGKNKIKAELMKRGVDSAIADEVLNEKFPEGNDVQNAIELAGKKLNIIISRESDPIKIKHKLFAFLSSRGYDYQTSKEAISKILGKDEEGNY